MNKDYFIADTYCRKSESNELRELGLHLTEYYTMQ
jgi:hypothetical protein